MARKGPCHMRVDALKDLHAPLHWLLRRGYMPPRKHINFKQNLHKCLVNNYKEPVYVNIYRWICLYLFRFV